MSLATDPNPPQASPPPRGWLRVSIVAALAIVFIGAAITSVFLDRGWLTRGPGRSLRVADGFDDRLEIWLAA